MLRYLKAAFFERLALPPLGDVPVNALGVAAAAILGIGHPAFWLLGAGLETAYLATLATNRRYQRVVDARDLTLDAGSFQQRHDSLLTQLTPADADRWRAVHARCERASDLARTHRQDETLIDSNREALSTLADLYLRLLSARQLLQSPDAAATEARLRRQMDELRRELSRPTLPASLRDSKSATLQILERRLVNFQRREQSLAEIESDLARIEAQVDLAVENAGLSSEPQAVSSNITLVSQWLEPDWRGVGLTPSGAARDMTSESTPARNGAVTHD